jgi:quercetin dioxygenase-like cupin family protein
MGAEAALGPSLTRENQGVDEDRFRQEMADEARAVSVWANGPGDRYAPHSHSYRKILCCLDGSITFHMGSGDVELTAGERVVIESGTSHSATVGPTGVRCAEAHVN